MVRSAAQLIARPAAPAIPLRGLFALAGSGGAKVDEVAAVRGVVPDAGLVLRAVVEDHRAGGVPAGFQAGPQPVLLGEQDVAEHGAGDLAPALALGREDEAAPSTVTLQRSFSRWRARSGSGCGSAARAASSWAWRASRSSYRGGRSSVVNRGVAGQSSVRSQLFADAGPARRSASGGRPLERVFRNDCTRLSDTGAGAAA